MEPKNNALYSNLRQYGLMALLTLGALTALAGIATELVYKQQFSLGASIIFLACIFLFYLDRITRFTISPKEGLLVELEKAIEESKVTIEQMQRMMKVLARGILSIRSGQLSGEPLTVLQERVVGLRDVLSEFCGIEEAHSFMQDIIEKEYPNLKGQYDKVLPPYQENVYPEG